MIASKYCNFVWICRRVLFHNNALKPLCGRSSFYQSSGSATRPSRPSPVFVPDEVTTPRPTSTTANPDSDTEILVPPPRPGPPGIPLGPPLNLQEDGFSEPPPAPQSALGGSGDPDTFSGYRRSGSSLRRFTSYDNKDTTLLSKIGHQLFMILFTAFHFQNS